MGREEYRPCDSPRMLTTDPALFGPESGCSGLFKPLYRLDLALG